MYRGLRETRNARVLYLDMNSFFTSVEQQLHPELRGLPIAVVSHYGPKGTVLAASYEAKIFGIKTGTRLREAFQYCPDLWCVPTTPGAYTEIHHRFMAILRDIFGPEVQARSIDEAAMYMAPNWQNSEWAWELSHKIKAAFKEKLGDYIRCSIGIAPNSLLAKLATDLQKPNGLVEITLATTPEILGGLDLQDLPGIAEGNSNLLIRHSITTPLALYEQSAVELYRLFGIWGQQWYWRLHGYEIDSSYFQTRYKTMSHQHVLKEWLYSVEAAGPVISRMTDRLIHRLRKNGFQCRSVSLYLNLKGAAGLFAEQKFDAPVGSHFQLLRSVENLAASFPKDLAGPIRVVYITFSDLVEEASGLQLDLFEDLERAVGISEALLEIRQRFGSQAIQLGNVVRLRPEIAKEELGFGRLKDRDPSGLRERF